VDLGELLTAVSQIGFPIFVGVWGIWFITMKIWPDHVKMQVAQTDALQALAKAIAEWRTLV
jgi:hypothetical protein